MNNAHNKVAFGVLLVASAALCVSFNLALRSSDLISMTYGDQALPKLGEFSGWLSILFQPWGLITVIAGLHHGWTSAIVAGLFSSVILSALSWKLMRNRFRLQYMFAGIWIIIALLNFWDLEQTTNILAEFNEAEQGAASNP